MGVRDKSPDGDLARLRRAELHALAGVPRGARFVLADLQVHTPFDARFEPGPEPQEPGARAQLAEAYLAKAVERGVSVVGITEHDDVSWIDELRAAAQRLGLHLLPGFEVEAREGVHILCLFDADTPVPLLRGALEDIGVGSTGPPPQHLPAGMRRHPREDTYTRVLPFAELLDTIQGTYGGVCIAAHAESNKGLLYALTGNARVRAWRTPELLAVQLSARPDEPGHRNPTIVSGEAAAYVRERLPAFLLTSDGRSFEDIGVPSTWIKLDEVSASGLRQAFVDAESRVAYDDPAALRRGPRLLALGWHRDGPLDGVRIGLSEQLTCLVGRNGAGKSAVVESIRYALDLRHATASSERAGEAVLAGVLGAGGGVALAVETDDELEPRRYLILRHTGGGEPIVCDADGVHRPDLDPRALVPARVYGEDELLSIAASGQAQLELIDALADDGGSTGGAGGPEAPGDGAGGSRGRRRGLVRRLNGALVGRVQIELGAQPAGVAIWLNVARPGEARSFRPLQQLTPGQRCGALLQIVLEAQTRARGPLVLDRPEDGLDAGAVDELLVPRLRELKRSGQVVVATHDHNLPPVCDAEQIVALETARGARKRQRAIRIRAQGALDRAEVRDALEDILEGGHASHSLRSAKYGL